VVGRRVGQELPEIVEELIIFVMVVTTHIELVEVLLLHKVAG
jgi:hypothetical protein